MATLPAVVLQPFHESRVMSLLSWRPNYSVGIDAIDAEHRHLFDLINRFHDNFQQGYSLTELRRVLSQLVAYSEEHFHREQAAMALLEYPHLSEHARIHDELYLAIFDLENRMTERPQSVDLDTLRFLRGWLLDHILDYDMQFGAFAARRGAGA